MEIQTCKQCGGAVVYDPQFGVHICEKCGAKYDFARVKTQVKATNSEAKSTSEHSAVAKWHRQAEAFLAQEDWQSADDVFAQITERDHTDALAYLGRMMAQLHVKRRDQLAELAQPFDDNYYYRSALWVADKALAEELEATNRAIRERNETDRLNAVYRDGLSRLQEAQDEQAYLSAAALFREAGDFQNAPSLANESLEKAEIAHKDSIYFAAKSRMQNATVHDYEKAIIDFTSIADWRDAAQLLEECTRKKEELQKQLTQRMNAERQNQLVKDYLEEKTEKRKRKLLLAITIPLLFLLIAGSVVFALEVYPHTKYIAAGEAARRSDVVTAYESFVQLGDYKDSVAQAAQLYEQYKSEKIKTALPGDTVYFGAYEQDNNIANGKEDISWRVLARENDKLLLISTYGLECMPFHESNREVSWENCTLRKWLNSDFMGEAFDAAQQLKIEITLLPADQNEVYEDSDSGSDTKDRVFLLSAAEAEHYFASDKDRVCLATAYAISHGSSIDESESVKGKTCWWYLRTTGFEQGYVAFVHFNGNVRYFGGGVFSANSTVRPAMWIQAN